MDFFTRRKPCIFIEEKQSIEVTKQCLATKLVFLQQQYKFCFESLHHHPQLAPEFIQQPLFLFDFGSKILLTLHHLSTSFEVEWAILRGFSAPVDKTYTISDTENLSVLRTDIICRESNFFFLKLLQFGAIDEEVFLNLARLAECANLLGITCVNDFSYYALKKSKIFSKKNWINEFDVKSRKVEERFYSFIGNRIVFKTIEHCFWSFLKETNSGTNYLLIKEEFRIGEYDYEMLRKKQSFRGLPGNQYKKFIDGLGNLNSFNKLYVVLSEFSTSNRKEIRHIFQHIFIFFFSQKGTLLFDIHNPHYMSREADVKIVDVIKFLDLIKFVVENSDVYKDEMPYKFENNLSNSCEIFLSILKNETIVRYIYAIHPSLFFMIVKLSKDIRKGKDYQQYRRFLDKYFLIIKDFQ